MYFFFKKINRMHSLYHVIIIIIIVTMKNIIIINMYLLTIYFNNKIDIFKFKQKLYNHNTVYEFEYHISTWIIFGKNLHLCVTCVAWWELRDYFFFCPSSVCPSVRLFRQTFPSHFFRHTFFTFLNNFCLVTRWWHTCSGEHSILV